MWIGSGYYALAVVVVLLTLIGGIFLLLPNSKFEVDLARILCVILPLFGVISFHIGYQYAQTITEQLSNKSCAEVDEK